jgi:peptidoglycan/LPS O-acetylase OafA/YrhL
LIGAYLRKHTLRSNGRRTELNPEHIPELDGLRGCAIAAVLIYHFSNELPKIPGVGLLIHFGWSGVDLFFVLSGFLITRILVKTRTRPGFFKNFYARRLLRIFPVYYWTLAVVIPLFGAVAALRAAIPSRHDLSFYWIYLQNWTPLMQALNQQSFGHFWSLAVEEQFYWIWPVVVWRVPSRRLMAVSISGFFLAFALRLLIPSHWFIWRATFTRMDALMMGSICTLALDNSLFKKWLSKRVKFFAIPSLCLLAAVIFGDRFLGERFTDTVGLSAIAVSYGLLLLYAAHAQGAIGAVLRSSMLTGLGKYSYGIYVYHLPLAAMLALIPIHSGLLMFALLMTGSIGLGAVSYELAEKRILRLKSRFA